MNKKTILTGIFLLGSQLSAVETEYFAGFGLTKTDINSTVSVFATTVSNEIKDTCLEYKAGAILDKRNKIYLSYSRINKENIEIKNFILNYDYLLEKNSSFTPYLGIYSGIADSDLKGSLTSNGTSIVTGAKVGLLYELSKNIEVETSFSYSKYHKDEKVKMMGNEIPNSSAKLDNSNNFYFGINYKFY